MYVLCMLVFLNFLVVNFEKKVCEQHEKLPSMLRKYLMKFQPMDRVEIRS